MAQAKKGDKVTVNYTGTLTDGTVFDTSENKKPLSFVVGRGQVIPGFEEAVAGMIPGEKKTVTIPVDKGYGQRNTSLVMPVPRAQVPPDISPEVGQKMQVGAPNGELLMVEVVEVTDKTVTLDANPPLAGKDLIFDIELLAIA